MHVWLEPSEKNWFPSDYLRLGVLNAVMSNLDHAINRDVAARLSREKTTAPYTAVNFYGEVWAMKDSDRWRCAVMRFHEREAVIEAGSLEEIMQACSERWGWE